MQWLLFRCDKQFCLYLALFDYQTHIAYFKYTYFNIFKIILNQYRFKLIASKTVSIIFQYFYLFCLVSFSNPGFEFIY